MGTITGQQILDIARVVANFDTARVSDANSLKLINEAMRDLVVMLPQANPVTTIVALTAGTRQTLAGLALTLGMQFIDMPRNFAADGVTVGYAIRRIPEGRKYLDEVRPNWHNDASAAQIRHFMTDEQDPTTAWVWPKADGTQKVQLIYSSQPTALAALGNAISLDDRYANPIGYLTLARMYQINEPGTLSQSMAQEMRALAAQVLGVSEGRIKQLDRSKDEA